MSIPGEIGQNIIRLRKRKGITQEELALNSNMSVSYLRKIESGSANPTIHALQRIANAMQESLLRIILPCGGAPAIEDAISFRMPLNVATAGHSDTTAPVCPRCKMLLQRKGQTYCDHCGQHLTWNNTTIC